MTIACNDNNIGCLLPTPRYPNLKCKRNPALGWEGGSINKQRMNDVMNDVLNDAITARARQQITMLSND